MNNCETMMSRTSDQVTKFESPDDAIRMFKSDRGFNINVAELTNIINTQGIEAARYISIPSVVREQRRGDEKCDTPTLSEVGVASVSYGNGFDFCQVIAGTDARPINIDNVLFVNSDPANTGISHGTAGVEIGSYFALGWKRRADSLILIYRVIGCELFLTAEEQQADRSGRQPRPIAKLTCQLTGHSRRTWKGSENDIPNELAALYRATEMRMQTDYRVPMYMDMIRMISSTESSRIIADQMKRSMFGPVEDCDPEDFCRKIYAEIMEIRNNQYAKLPTGSDAKRRVGPLHAIETIELDRASNTITIEVVIPRDDDTMTQQFRTVLTSDNFFDEDGRVVLERGLVLKSSSFERLRTELESRRDPVISVHLASIR